MMMMIMMTMMMVITVVVAKNSQFIGAVAGLVHAVVVGEDVVQVSQGDARIRRRSCKRIKH